MTMLESSVDEILTQLEANQLYRSAQTGKICDVVLPQKFDADLKFEASYGNIEDDYMFITIAAHPFINLHEEEMEDKIEEDIIAFKQILKAAKCDKDFTIIIHKD